MSGPFTAREPQKPKRVPLDLDRAALLLVGGGLVLFVLLNQLGSLAAYFAPILAALKHVVGETSPGAGDGFGYGWFDSETHNGLLNMVPDLLLYAGVIAFALRRIGAIWERWSRLNIFAVFALRPQGQSAAGAGIRMNEPGGAAGSDPFVEPDEPALEPDILAPAAAPVSPPWVDEPPIDPTDPIAAGPSAWRARLLRAYAILTARREGAPRAKTERARDALRMLLLPPGMKTPDDQGKPQDQGPS